MASGDVALEVTGSVRVDESHREANSTVQHSVIGGTNTVDGVSYTFSVDVSRSWSQVPGMSETPFDSTKSYKITFTEV